MLNRNDDSNEIKKMIMLCVAAASCVLLIFLGFIYSNETKQKKKNVNVVNDTMESEPEEGDIEVGKKNFVSEDLDFWDMYDEGYPYSDDDNDEIDETEINSYKSFDSLKKDNKRDDKKDDKQPDNSMNNDSSDDQEFDDGKHIKVETEAGSISWHEILEEMPKSNIELKNNISFEDGILKYTNNGTKAKLGIDVSKSNGTLDYEKIKKAGVDFAIVKIGARGYSKGDILLDDKFVEYANGFNGANIPIGGYFTSMAITDVEAVEEANYAVAACVNYGIKYPIAIEMSVVKNDSYRTNKLTNKDRTTVIKSFCDTVKNYGYTPMICADRNYLLSKVNLLELKEYDFWVKDELSANELPVNQEDDETEDSSDNETSDNKKLVGTDYPYKYTMWQYTTNGSINGIDASTDINLCFVNYEDR